MWGKPQNACEKIKGELNNWRNTLSLFMDKEIQYCYGISFSQLDLQIQYNSSRIISNFFFNIDKLILRFIWRGKRFKITNTIMKENHRVEGPTLLEFKTSYKAIVIKTVRYVWKNRQISQKNRIEGPEIHSH